MKKIDLHDEFIHALQTKIPNKSELANQVADILQIELESAKRRIRGTVHFSLREAGIVAGQMNISLDQLMHKGMDKLWIPLMLEHPARFASIDVLGDMFYNYIRYLNEMNAKPVENGNVYHSLPLEFYMHYPTLYKFMLFKWGHYFVKNEEFNNFTQWRVPESLMKVKSELAGTCNFKNVFYIWDRSLLNTLVCEIANFHRMHVITATEKDAILLELKELMVRLEQVLNGIYRPEIFLSSDVNFYVSDMNLGFTSNYFGSEEQGCVIFMTHFSYSLIDNCSESYHKMKEWIRSLSSVSVQISRSSRIERRLFFETQYQLLNGMLEARQT